jgi:hypothetical protein
LVTSKSASTPAPIAEGLDLGVLQDLVGARLLDVQDLAPDGQDRLISRITRVLRRTARRITFDDEEFALARIVRGTVDELAGQTRAVEGALAPGEVAGLSRRHPCARRLDGFGDNLTALFRILLEPVGESLVGRALDE